MDFEDRPLVLPPPNNVQKLSSTVASVLEQPGYNQTTQKVSESQLGFGGPKKCLKLILAYHFLSQLDRGLTFPVCPDE